MKISCELRQLFLLFKAKDYFRLVYQSYIDPNYSSCYTPVLMNTTQFSVSLNKFTEFRVLINWPRYHESWLSLLLEKNFGKTWIRQNHHCVYGNFFFWWKKLKTISLLGQNFILAHISIYGQRNSIYGYMWIIQYGNVLYVWASMKFFLLYQIDLSEL